MLVSLEFGREKGRRAWGQEGARHLLFRSVPELSFTGRVLLAVKALG